MQLALGLARLGWLLLVAQALVVQAQAARALAAQVAQVAHVALVQVGLSALVLAVVPKLQLFCLPPCWLWLRFALLTCSRLFYWTVPTLFHPRLPTTGGLQQWWCCCLLVGLP